MRTDSDISVTTSLTWKERFTDLLARHGISMRGPRGIVRCLFHQDKTPSLSIDIERGLFHCFGCGASGGVRKFAELLGEKWANNHRSETQEARADRIAHDRVREDFRAWKWQNIFDLTDWHRDLLTQREDAQIACRAIEKNPDSYSQKEKLYWTSQPTSLKEQLDSLQRELDIFADDRFMPERIARWALEQKGANNE